MRDRPKPERKAPSRLVEDPEYADAYSTEGKRNRGHKMDASYSDESDDDE